MLLLTNWEKIAAQKCIWLAQRLPFQWSPWRATRNVLKGTVIIQVYLDHCLVHWASCSPKQWTLSCQWERAAVSCDSPNPGPGYAGSFQSPESQCAVVPLCACVRAGKVGCAAAPPGETLLCVAAMRKADCCHNAQAPDLFLSGPGVQQDLGCIWGTASGSLLLKQVV